MLIVRSISEVGSIAYVCASTCAPSKFKYVKFGGKWKESLCPFVFFRFSQVMVVGMEDKALGENETQLLHCISRTESFGRVL